MRKAEIRAVLDKARKAVLEEDKALEKKQIGEVTELVAAYFIAKPEDKVIVAKLDVGGNTKVRCRLPFLEDDC